MTLGEKIRYLREVEGSLRELGRPMTQQEIVRAVRDELGKSISQSYLSQIERGSRRHMTQSSRMLLARFFKVHPGFLVDDPEGYTPGLQSDLRAVDAKIDSWLYAGAEHFAADPEMRKALLEIAQFEDSRRAVLLLAEILRAQGLADRLEEVLRPDAQQASGHPPPSSAV